MIKNSITHKKKVIEIPDTHALLSASSAHRWIACPPSARISQYFPESKSEASEEGTKAHDTAEKILKGELEGSDDPNVMYYVDLVHRVLDLYRKEGLNPKLFIEQRVDYSHVAKGGFGTSDCIVLTEKYIHILDFKNGNEEVQAEFNPQLRLYAIGAVELFGFTGQIVRMTIVQPKTKHKQATETLLLQDLIKWSNIIKPYAAMAWEGSGVLTAGEHCNFCKYKPLCPAYKKQFKEMYIDSLNEIKYWRK